MSISKIYFRGHNSGEFPGVTVASCDYGDTELKRADEEIAGRDGSLTTLANGRHYKARQMTIVFNVKATPTTVEGVMSSLRAWLSGGVGEFTDDFNTGWQLTNVCFASAHTDYIDMFRGCGQLTVKMTADPYWSRTGEVNERVLKFAANGGATLTVTNNSAYSVTANGTTTTGSFTAAEPYKYRLVCYAENPETITLNGSAIAAEEVFTMPSSAEIIVSATGYKYVELWHDTRTEVRI
jgi:phage-related protein